MRPVPSLLNPFAWLVLCLKNERMIRGRYDYDVVVLELGTDHAGDMRQLKGILKIDYTLLTAITPEHMEGFADLDDVAKDELIATTLAELTILDADSVPKEYVQQISDPVTISTTAGDCVIKPSKLDKIGREVTFEIHQDSIERFKIQSKTIGLQNVPALAFALLMGLEMGLSREQILHGLESNEPFSGRMNLLQGKRGSLLIDDTYNSSPHALKAALDTLYELDIKQKIAVIGQMNEMGKFSEGYHREAGGWCDPKQLSLLVTLGEHANSFLAEEAEKHGCKVVRCSSPYQAADVVLPLLKKDTAVLLKGSQGGIFLEEATRALLDNPEDAQKLVRQSAHWMKVKQKVFSE